jgi:alpha-beta hydrolase superfamily lysophospholipase
MSNSQDADIRDEHRRFTLQTHAGFLNSTEALLPEVSSRVSRLIQQSGAKHVLFTGHSAGGAVASLLFSHVLCKSEPECEQSLTSACIWNPLLLPPFGR